MYNVITTKHSYRKAYLHDGFNTINNIIQSSNKVDSNIKLEYKFKGFIFVSSCETDTCFLLDYSSTISATKCKCCSMLATRNKGYRTANIRFGKMNNKSIIIRFKKKLFKCEKCNKSTVQASPNTSKKCQHSDSYLAMAINALKANVTTYTHVAKEYGTSI